MYMLDDEMKWKVVPPMPKPNSHIECAWVLVNNSIIITGGTTEKHPVTNRMILVGEVFQFHLDTLVYILSLYNNQTMHIAELTNLFSMLFIYHCSNVSNIKLQKLFFSVLNRHGQ